MDTDVLVVGAGQSGLALSRELTARGVAHEVVDARTAPGDVWRDRWDSLRLFTPAPFDALPGLPFPGASRYRPTAREFADYLDAYAERFALPLHGGVRVTRVATDHRGGFTAHVDDGNPDSTWRARRVVVATGGNDVAHIPAESAGIDQRVVQRHSSQYRRPDDLPSGRVLVVGSGTSGVQLGVELVRSGRRVTVAGTPTPSIPAPLLAAAGGLWFGFLHRALTRATPIGRKAAPKAIGAGAPLIGISARDLDRAGVDRRPRFVGTVDGLPQLADGSVIEADSVLWATGYRPSLGWIDRLALDEHGLPEHERGISTTVPGLAFMGLPFQYGLTSTLIGGAGRDAEFVAARLAA